MILNASQRGGAMQLGAHLLKTENDQAVEVHEMRGFMADDIKGAMKEAYAISKGTRCQQHLFSVSLNPPANENVSLAAFEDAIDRIEDANGLSGQPRIVVFHTKEGRRHAHCVWSRIDADTMTARPLPFFKAKLREVSKALYLEYGWEMPRGLMDSRERDPRNFTLAEWQQAKRMGRDAGALKAAIQECWSVSKDRPDFESELAARGLYLARGDRRAHVVVTYEGEVLSVARMVGKRAKEITARLGSPDAARSLSDTREDIASMIAPRLKHLVAEQDRWRDAAMKPLTERRLAMKNRHADERQRLDEGQDKRRIAETRLRAEQLRPGLRGLLDRLTGRQTDTIRRNEGEAVAAFKRDRAQRDDLTAGQLADRRDLHRDIVAVRHAHAASVQELHRDLARQGEARQATRESVRDRFKDAASGKPTLTPPSPPRQILRGRGSGRDGPGLGR